jgi:hypothetical protein
MHPDMAYAEFNAFIYQFIRNRRVGQDEQGIRFFRKLL